MKKIVYKVYSVRTYDKDYIGQQGTFVRIDQLLYDGPAFAEMDSTVYDIDDFQDIHAIYIVNRSPTLEYDFTVYTKYVERIKREIMSLQ